jgi:hypothetical protein
MKRHKNGYPGTMSSRWAVGASAALWIIVIFAGVAAAEDAKPAVSELLAKVKAGLEPSRPSVRDLEIVIRAPDGAEKKWTGREARKEIAGKASVAIVLIGPPSVAGFAVLASETDDKSREMWMYVPPIERVRKLVYATKFQPFLGTDVTYGDLGLVDLPARSFRLVGTEDLNGRSAHKVESIPVDETIYSRVVTWIDTNSDLPVRREYYDRVGALWRVADYGSPTTIGGVPTLLGITVKDVQDGYATELRYSNVEYDVELADDLFDPKKLASLATDPSPIAGNRGKGLK